MPLLRRLEAESLLVLTPPQDYDDSYCVSYARSHGGCVLSNDLYRDQLVAAQVRVGVRVRVRVRDRVRVGVRVRVRVRVRVGVSN